MKYRNNFAIEMLPHLAQLCNLLDFFVRKTEVDLNFFLSLKHDDPRLPQLLPLYIDEVKSYLKRSTDFKDDMIRSVIASHDATEQLAQERSYEIEKNFMLLPTTIEEKLTEIKTTVRLAGEAKKGILVTIERAWVPQLVRLQNFILQAEKLQHAFSKVGPSKQNAIVVPKHVAALKPVQPKIDKPDYQKRWPFVPAK